jgi:hypothetical protein
LQSPVLIQLIFFCCIDESYPSAKNRPASPKGLNINSRRQSRRMKNKESTTTLKGLNTVMNKALQPVTDKIFKRIFASAFYSTPLGLWGYISVIGPGLHPGLLIFKPFGL